MIKPFVNEICEYIADNLADFTFGSGDTNLKVGELLKGTDGTFGIETVSPEPDSYTPVEQHIVDFWSVNRDSAKAFDQSQQIYNLLNNAINYDTDSRHIYFSKAMSQPNDQDRDGEGRKIVKLSVLFIVTSLIS